jgi:outer membrane protein, heavy metal efflux system
MRFTLSVFLLSVFLPILPLAAWAQTPLTEAEAVRLGLARGDLSDLDQADVRMAEADALAAGQIPNPTLSYSRDRVGGSPDTVEQSWMLSQTFDLSGKRKLHREAAERRVELASAGNAMRRSEFASEIRRAFHEVVFQQETLRATETWVQRFARVEGMVGKLARAGEASGYDRRRLARERQAAEARLATGRAEIDRSLARLVALIGVPQTPVVAGELLPPALPAIETALDRLEQRPDLRALSLAAQAADLDGRAAKQGRIPDLTAGIGPKWVDDGISRDSGVALTLSIPLPVFDRQQAGQQRAAAEAARARAEYRLAHARAEGELRGLHRQAEALRTAASEYRAQAATTTPELLRIAEAAYQGGESSLLELLDVYRGTLESEIAALELSKRARDARIEYELLTGSTE